MRKNRLWILVALGLLWNGASQAFEPGSEFQDAGLLPGVRVDLRYASEHNFLGENLYGDLRKAYLRREAADKLAKAAAQLAQLKPGWSLLVFDALRPRSIQRRLWAKVKGTPQESYVADPDKGSIHNFGMAVDLSLADEKGAEIDMGTPFDSFQDLAQPKYEEKFLKQGRLTPAQVQNRKLLRKAMTEAGFLQLPNEWWHYDALPPREVRSKFRIVE